MGEISSIADYTVHFTLSDVITLVSILVTLASIAWAIREKREARTAQAQAARFRRLFIRQQIVEQFDQVPQLALELQRTVRSRSWQAAAEAALRLTAELATLRGANSMLLGEEHQNDLEEALNLIAGVNSRIPSDNPASAGLPELVDACNIIVVRVHTIKRVLKVKVTLGGEANAE